MSVDWVTLRDNLNLTLKPIDQWPGKPTSAWSREKGPFTASLKDTLATLRKEMNALRAKSIVLQIAIKPHQLRLDGLPRAGATAEHLGVILAFDSSKGPLRIWFDKFTKWESNLRAIAMHLEHLRLATLYGVGEDGQAYRGWTAIPPPKPETSDLTTAVRSLYEFIGRTYSPVAERDPEEARKLILSARTMAHPDRGGSAEEFYEVTKAAKILKEHHGL